MPDVLERVNSPEYFTHLRIFVDKLTEGNNVSLLNEIKDQCDVAQLDIKYKPVLAEGSNSTFRPSRELFSLNEAIVDEYIDHSDTDIHKDDLLDGYRLLNEDS